MRVLVVYESLWGNTERVARAIASRLEDGADVALHDTDRAPGSVDGYDLLVAGGPTHAFSMSRARTRADAAQHHAAPHQPDRGLREWLEDLERPTRAIRAVTFDTRVDKPHLPGSAARAARHELRLRGFDTSPSPQTFRVHGYEGPLVDGEVERAAAWAGEMLTLGDHAST